MSVAAGTPPRNPQLSCIRGLVRGALASNDFVQDARKGWSRTLDGLARHGEVCIRVGVKSGLTLAASTILKDRFLGRRVLWICAGVSQADRDADVVHVSALSDVAPRLPGPYACVVLDPGHMFRGRLGTEVREFALEVADPEDFRLLVLG